MFSWPLFRARSAHPLIAAFEAHAQPKKNLPIARCPLVAIDLELTGLDPARDHIVSIGWVPIRERSAVLAEARHHLIRSPVSVGQSATLHGLHDRDLTQARELEEVLAEILASFGGHVFAAHHAQLDEAFLRVAFNKFFGRAPRWQFIDTLRIEGKRLNRRNTLIKEGGLRLGACLERHKLPVAQSHNALEDAFSCALLLLAQIAETNREDLSLADLLRESR